MPDIPWELIYLVLVLIGVIALAYYVSKWLSKRYAVQGQNTKYLKVIDRIVIGQDRSLCIVKVGEKSMLLGVTQHNISKICDLDSEDLPEVKTNQASFTNTLKSTLKNNWGFGMGKMGKMGNIGNMGKHKDEEGNLDDK